MIAGGGSDVKAILDEMKTSAELCLRTEVLS